MLKTIRQTSKYLNIGKYQRIYEIDANVKMLKNRMAKFVFDNILELMEVGKYEFGKHYKEFKDLSPVDAWETQQIFMNVIVKYITRIDTLLSESKFEVQDSFRIERYKRNTKNHRIGDIKRVVNKKHMAKLGNILSCLLVVKDFDNIYNENVRLIFNSYTKEKQDRIIRFILNRRRILLSKVKLVTFKDGSYKKLGNTTSKSGLSCFQVDETNTKYQFWYRYKVKSGFINIPLEINNQYHTEFRNHAICTVQVKNNRINIYATKDVDAPRFKPTKEIIGIDINMKHNLLCCSNGFEVDYDRKYLLGVTKVLKTIDKVGYQNLPKNKKKMLEKLVKRNEWYFRQLLSIFLDYCEENNITDIVMEDLNLRSKLYGFETATGFSYTRICRLLHMSNIKNWLKSQAEKRGIRVHITPSSYTSQQCPKCGNIDTNNRKIQENFKCTECDYESNADHNASINIRTRYTLDVLRLSGLHKMDTYGRLEPKTTSKYRIKDILLELEDKLDRSMVSVD